MALTKKQEQELRAAQAEQARIEKLEAELEAARQKVLQRANKRRAEINRAIERKRTSLRAQHELIEKATAAIEQIEHDIRVLEDTLDGEDNTNE